VPPHGQYIQHIIKGCDSPFWTSILNSLPTPVLEYLGRTSEIVGLIFILLTQWTRWELCNKSKMNMRDFVIKVDKCLTCFSLCVT
jgi:hypothetical protein